MYVFFYDLECMKTNGDTYVKLMKNAANTGIESYCHGLGDIDNSSTLGVLYLEAGDMVSIRLSNSDSKSFWIQNNIFWILNLKLMQCYYK